MPALRPSHSARDGRLWMWTRAFQPTLRSSKLMWWQVASQGLGHDPLVLDRVQLLSALREERAELLALLDDLSPEEWRAPSLADGWRVKDVALHILDGDLGWLSRGRDGDQSRLIKVTDDYRAFVAALDAKNQRWVEGASGLSRRLVRELLAWTGDQVASYHESLDLTDPKEHITWARGIQAPGWLGVGRDFTERWVHQMQIRGALGREGDHDRFLPVVLSVFVWGFPAQYRVEAAAGTVVLLDFGAAGSWHLRNDGRQWVLGEGEADKAVATLQASPDAAWKLLTGADYDRGVSTIGPPAFAEPLLRVRSIIV